MAAQAETRTVTLKVDDATHISQVKFYGFSGDYNFSADNEVSVTFGDVNGDNLFELDVYAATGYQLTAITCNGEPFEYIYGSLPKSDLTIRGYISSYGEFTVNDGDVIEITTAKEKEPEAKILTVKALHPEHIKNIMLGWTNYDATLGEWEFDVTNTNQYIKIYTQPNFPIRSITDKDGNTFDDAVNETLYMIWTGDFTESNSFVIDTYDLDEVRSASLNVSIVNGTASDVTFYRGGQEVSLSGTESVVKFNPDTESKFKVIRYPSYKNLYKVELDGEVIPKTDSYHNFEPKDGSNLVITVDAPDVDVPVKFVFPNEGTEGVLSRVSCNSKYYSAEECLLEGFTLKLGSIFYLELNEADYEVNEILYNGQDGTRGVIETEDEYVVTITATKRPMQTVTFKCAAWEHIALEDDWYHKITLTGESTVFEAAELPPYFVIATKDGYVLNSVTDEATGNNLLEEGYYGSLEIRNFTDGMTIVIDAEPFARDKEMVIYLEDAEWTDTRIFLSSYTDHEQPITLNPGYTHVTFGIGDFNDNTWAIEPDYVMYLNDEPVEFYSRYGYQFPIIDEIKAGDVLKIYAEEKDTHTISYDIAEGVSAAVFHDHVTAVESPATHAVLPGTEIHIKPVATMAARAAASPLVVKVNDQTIEPAADGVYTITADGDKNIKVENDPSTSIAEISADAADKAFDIMGRRVNANHRGITIVNGKKVMK